LLCIYTCVCTCDGIVYIFVMYSHVCVHVMVLCTSLLCTYTCVCTCDGIVYIFVMYTHVSVHVIVLCIHNIYGRPGQLVTH
jgi:hypothetical protein